MILTLVRELRRSQGRYARAAFVLVLLAVTLASFAMVSISTRAAEQDRIEIATSSDKENIAWVGSWTNGPRADWPTLADEDPAVVDAATFGALASDIRSTDPQAVSSISFVASLLGVPGPSLFVAPDAVPSLALADGRAPGPGEIALSPMLAADLGVGLGDDVALAARSDVPSTDLKLSVTGILRIPSAYAGGLVSAEAMVSPFDAPSLARSTAVGDGVNAGGGSTTLLSYSFVWDGPVPASAALLTYESGELSSTGFGYAGNGELAAAAFAALLALATLVAAGVAGRNQGQARSQWVGTMRALGATRRDVVAATLVEAAIMGAVASVLGGAIGWGINAGLVARTQASTPGTFLPTIAPYPGWALGITVLLGVLLAGALGAVPAYWAARTSPSEALKPTAPFDARPLRWRIPTWAFGASALVAGALLWFDAADSAVPGMATRWMVPLAAVAILGAAGLMSRLVGTLVPHVGAQLSRSRHPWIFAAGDSLRSRPRQATGVATVLAVPSAGIGVLAWISALLEFWTVDGARTVLPWSDAVLQAGLVVLAASASLGIAAAVMGMAVWMGRGRDAGEAATRGALGLSRNARQLAAMAESSVAALVGGVVGVTLGIVGAGLTQLSLDAWGSSLFPVPGTVGQIAARLLLMYAAALLGVVVAAGVVSLWSARSVDAKTPVAARRIASAEGAA